MGKCNPGLNFFIGIGALSSGALILQVSLTRIFAVSQWYHFAFMVVSIALLGYGASGSFLMIFRSRFTANYLNSLRITAFIFALSTILCYLIANRISFDTIKLAWDKYQLLRLFGYYFFLAVPFFFAGLTIAIALTSLSKVVGKIYFADLLGAGLGGLGSLAIFAPFGASGAVVIASLLGAVAAFCFSSSNKGKLRIIFLFLIISLALLLWNKPDFLKINISSYKSLMLALKYPRSQLLQTRWNSFSRIDVLKSPLVRFAPGLSLSYLKPLPTQIGITIDGDNLNAITKFSGKREELEFTAYLPSSLPFYVAQKEKVLVIEPIGGLDVLTALYHNSKSIKAIELNPLIIDLINNKYGEFSGRIYEGKKVTVSLGEPRAVLRGVEDRFDIILLSPSDVLGAASSGIYGLSEDYLFTRESIINFYHHLKKNGLFCITLYLLPPPRQELRLASIAIDALQSLRVKHPEKHLAAIRSWGTITLLLKKSAFSLKDIDRIKNFCHERQFDTVYYDGIKGEEVNLYNQFPRPVYFEAISSIVDESQREEFYKNYLYNVKSVSDDKPFFYQFFRLSKVPQIYRSIGYKWQPFIQGDYLVFIIFGQALIASLFFIVLPLLFREKEVRTTNKSTKVRNVPLLSYFFFIGLGFMLIEISMIQKFILVLAHPVYSMSIVLVGLLVFSGFGSLASEKFSFSLSIIIISLAGLVIGYSIFMPYMVDFIISQIAKIRSLLTLLIIFPLGFFMGMCFPRGIRILSTLASGLIPWAWCVNGCSSVLSSVLAVMIALAIGFRPVFALAGISYLLALLCLALSRLRPGGHEKQINAL